MKSCPSGEEVAVKGGVQGVSTGLPALIDLRCLPRGWLLGRSQRRARSAWRRASGRRCDRRPVRRDRAARAPAAAPARPAESTPRRARAPVVLLRLAHVQHHRAVLGDPGRAARADRRTSPSGSDAHVPSSSRRAPIRLDDGGHVQGTRLGPRRFRGSRARDELQHRIEAALEPYRAARSTAHAFAARALEVSREHFDIVWKLSSRRVERICCAGPFRRRRNPGDRRRRRKACRR